MNFRRRPTKWHAADAPGDAADANRSWTIAGVSIGGRKSIWRLTPIPKADMTTVKERRGRPR
jgi:hypothetical protein